MYNWIRNAISTLSGNRAREITPVSLRFHRVYNVANGKFSWRRWKKKKRLKSNRICFDTNRYFRLLTRFIYCSVLSWLIRCHMIYVILLLLYFHRNRKWTVWLWTLWEIQNIKKKKKLKINSKKKKKTFITLYTVHCHPYTIRNHHLLKTHYLW